MTDIGTCPRVVREFSWSTCFGRVSFAYTLEDRRPDLSEAEAVVRPGYKYKLLINFRFFGLRVGVVSHSISPGYLFVNGVEYSGNNATNPGENVTEAAV